MSDGTIAVYFMSNKKDGTIYIGSSALLERRIFEHKTKVVKGFTAKYNLDKLVCVEACETLEQALILERRYKKYYRDWKIRLIEEKIQNGEI